MSALPFTPALVLMATPPLMPTPPLVSLTPPVPSAPLRRRPPPSVPLLRAVAELAAEIGAGQTFEFLLGRQLDANPRQYTLTPPAWPG